MANRATDLTVWAALVLLAGAGIAASAERGAARAPENGRYPVATDTRVAGDASQTRFVMDFSRKVELRAFALADPYRVVIDLPQTVFNLPPKIGETGRGLIKAFRFGLIMQGGSRIVLDVSKPVRIDRAFVLDPVAGQPARLVVDLSAVDRQTFMRTLELERPPLRTTATGTLEPSLRTRAIRARSSCSIPGTAASTTALSPPPA